MLCWVIIIFYYIMRNTFVIIYLWKCNKRIKNLTEQQQQQLQGNWTGNSRWWIEDDKWYDNI